MKKMLSSSRSIYVIAIFFIFFSSCGKQNPLTGEYLTPESSYVLNGNMFKGQGDVDTTLKAIEIPCSNNNTMRMYISDSLQWQATGFENNDLKIVSYAKRDHLNKYECCLEITSSVTDTWLSTGTGNVDVAVRLIQYNAGISTEKNAIKFSLGNASVQRFTSVPTTDIGSVTATLIVKQ